MLAALILACCLQAPAEVTVDTDRLTRGAVVPLGSGDPGAAAVLGSAPQPALARRVTKPEFISKISSAGLSATGLEFPDSVLVRRKSELLDPERVRLAVQQAFARQFPQADVTLLSTDIPQTPLPSGSYELTGTIPSRS